jgi:hypothetical protein
MQIVYVAGATRRELDVRVNNPSATVAEPGPVLSRVNPEFRS